MNGGAIQPLCFTAAQIARALCRPVRSTRQELESISEGTILLVAGNATKAWEFSRLPVKMQKNLTFRASQQGYRNEEALLQASCKTWMSHVPWSKVSPEAQAKAMKWREALRSTWERREMVSQGELARLGIEDHARIFKYTISERQWRAIFKRTVERDNGAENFERLEIYLDETVRPEERCPVRHSDSLIEFADLEALMNRWPDRLKPSKKMRQLLWIRIFEVFEERLSLGRSEKALKKTLLQYLIERAPFLSKTAAGLRVNFGVRFARWVEGGRHANTQGDNRAERSGNFRGPDLTAEEWSIEADKLIAYAVAITGGRIAQAWRELTSGRTPVEEKLRLNPKLLSYYIANPASKSYVPKRIIKLARSDVRIVDPLYRSKKQHDLNGAFISVDWSGSYSNQAHCADDTTPPIYFRERNDEGKETLMRGQLLLMIDVVSGRILGFVLIPERNYGSFHIHTLYTRVWSETGLPEYVIHEGGIWDKSRLLKGKMSEYDALPGDEIELGLREFGIKFRHAKRARGKPVERKIGAIQTWMERLPGYCGRDEIKDRYDDFQQLKKDIEAGRVSAEGRLFTRSQLENKIEEICEAYNAEPQDGELDGLSPEEAYKKFQNHDNPPIRFDAGCRYLLAHYKRPMKVGRNGITIRIGKNSFNYHSEETGRIIGETVLAWFNPEAPEILTITDMQRKNPRCIARSESVPGLDAPKELLEQELRKVAAHQGYAKERYRVLKAKFKQVFRKNIVDAPTAQLGAEFEMRQEAIRQEKQTERKNSRMAAQMGVVLPPGKAGQPEQTERLNRFKASMDAARRAAEAEQMEGN